MRVVVIGLGSMGKRRIRLIRKYDNEIVILGIDTDRERRETCAREYNIETYENLSQIKSINTVDCAFICTPPLAHSKLITQCLQLGMHIFSELNLVYDGYQENVFLANQKKLVLFMSSTFLYRNEIKKIKSLVHDAKCLANYIYHVGQYLPDWHPWENYNDFFVSDKRSNGCREIFAIELPWLTDTFGEIIEVDVVKNKMSNLKLNYNDNYLVILQHSSGHKGILAVDVVSRRAVRDLEIFGERLYIQWDGSPKGLRMYDYDQKRDLYLEIYKEIDQLDNYSSFVVENAYYNEIVSFFEAVLMGKPPLYSFEKDRRILEIIDRIEA
ncbi:MAG TPA: Gfo/Idh/MocA family oxidoreductase [Defluviitaleaceae bacterium]|nr:Gfo/Idh/MocA family oxidoreductase [Defluviitaleaceae bacterium]